MQLSCLTGLRPHLSWLIAMTALWLCETLFVAYSGPIKTSAERDWIDILSEGLVLGFLLYCFVLVLSARAPGKVTHLFASGLLILMLAFGHDVLDEFWHIEHWQALHSWLEFFPLGLLLIMLGLYGWRQEQLTINRHFRRRQSVLSSLVQFDHTTGSATVPHLCAYLEQRQNVLCLAVVEVSNMAQWQRQFGYNTSDDALLKLNELLLFNLRADELLCHLGSGLFIAALCDGPVNRRLDQLQQHLNNVTLYSDEAVLHSDISVHPLEASAAAVHHYIQAQYRVAG